MPHKDMPEHMKGNVIHLTLLVVKERITYIDRNVKGQKDDIILNCIYTHPCDYRMFVSVCPKRDKEFMFQFSHT